ncbi:MULTISPECIES: CynX/NimT family MFS transporter [unclassified Brevibacterium]|uniref:MFS transporter n=1 Tax=unclassified Brevibacterium TaxID=2614124 RepID=UPI00107FE829|nr:MFS transporter [Brevibacterium sp. S111]TGD12352.1 MFS transporter [Brevibacterium sp. S111]
MPTLPHRTDAVSPVPGNDRTWIAIVACGVVAAMHVWKLPGALTFIRQDLGMSLVQSGTLLGIVQVGAMVLGLSGSILSERIGLRTTMLVGLSMLSLGSLVGALSQQTWQLMTTRGFEGIGFLLVTLVAPPLIRQNTSQDRASVAMGWWSAFQGIAVFLAVLVSTVLLDGMGWVNWQFWWMVMGVLTAAMIPISLRTVPGDSTHSVDLGPALSKIGHTLKTLMPWIMSLIFACYTLQWGAIIGFLPDIVGGHSGLVVGLATAVVGGVNGVGNVIAGQMLNRGVRPRAMVMTGMTSMVITTVVIFAPDWSAVSGGVWIQLAAAVVFSGVAALIPATVTRIAVDAAPADGSASAVMGLMIQVYNAANFIGPVVLTSIAAAAGGWHLSWVVTIGASLIGAGLGAFFLNSRRLTMSFTG